MPVWKSCVQKNNNPTAVRFFCLAGLLLLSLFSQGLLAQEEDVRRRQQEAEAIQQQSIQAQQQAEAGQQTEIEELMAQSAMGSRNARSTLKSKYGIEWGSVRENYQFRDRTTGRRTKIL